MQTFKAWMSASHVIWALLALAVECLASVPSDQALASVSVVRIRIKIAADQAELHQTDNRFPNAIPEIVKAREPADAFPVVELHRTLQVNQTLMAQQKDLSSETDRLNKSLEEVQRELVETKSLVSEQANVLAELKANANPSESIANSPPPPIDEKTIQLASLSLTPMRMEPLIPVAESGPPADRPIDVWTIVSDDCPPCHSMQDHNKSDNRVNLNYVGGSTGNPIEQGMSNIATAIGRVPITYWYDASGLIRYQVGYMNTDQIWQKIQGNNPPSQSQRSYAAAGAAGTIHAAAQIRQGFNYFGTYVGDGVTASMLWNRPQAKLSLLAMSSWDIKDLTGTNGRMQFDVPKAINLPVKSLAFVYRLIGRDIKINMEDLLLVGMLDQLSPNHVQSVGATPSGIIGIDDALLLYNIFAMLRDIFLILHPTADVILPEEISATAILNGDKLTITFDKAPSVCLRWLFTFNLAVKTVVITESNIHVEFSGSRFIKSRDFAVSE